MGNEQGRPRARRQGAGRASPYSDSGQLSFPPVRSARNCSNPSRAAQKNNPLTVSKLFFSRCWRSQAATGCSGNPAGAGGVGETGQRLMLGHVAILRVQAKFAKSPCCRFGTGSRGGAVGDAVCAKAVTDRSWAVFFLRGVSFRVLRALRKQTSEPSALTRAAKGPQLQWPAKRAKSSGNQAGGALANGRAGPGQGGKAPGEQALTVTAGNSFGPRETVPIQPGRAKKNRFSRCSRSQAATGCSGNPARAGGAGEID